MSATVSSTFSRRFRRVAAGLAASLALGALSAHAAPTPFPADFRSSQVVNADATINVRAVLDKLGIDRADIVGHDIGTMVAYAYAARYPDKTSRLVVMDSPVPGIAPWNQIVRLPALWHFNFGGPDAERLVAGRERIYLDRFWNEFAGDPSKIDEATRRHYAAIYA